MTRGVNFIQVVANERHSGEAEMDGTLRVALGSQFMALPASGGEAGLCPPVGGPAVCVKMVQLWVCAGILSGVAQVPISNACSWDRGGPCFLSSLCTLVTAYFLTQFSFHPCQLCETVQLIILCL